MRAWRCGRIPLADWQTKRERTAAANHKIVNFWDTTFNLPQTSFQTYPKPNEDPWFISSRSNHPPLITNERRSAISKRISPLSFDCASFESAYPLYEKALKRSYFNAKLRLHPWNTSKLEKLVSYKRRINIHLFPSTKEQSMFIRVSRMWVMSCMGGFHCHGWVGWHGWDVMGRSDKETSKHIAKTATNARSGITRHTKSESHWYLNIQDTQWNRPLLMYLDHFLTLQVVIVSYW